MLDVSTGRQISVDVRALPVGVMHDRVQSVAALLRDGNVDQQGSSIETSLCRDVASRRFRQAVRNHAGGHRTGWRAADRERRGRLHRNGEVVFGAADFAGRFQRPGERRRNLRQVRQAQIEADVQVLRFGPCSRAVQRKRDRWTGQR